MNNDFAIRIRNVIAKRHIYRWGARIGVSRGTINRMVHGHPPGPESLEIIQKTENLSLDWLINGRGRQFLINFFRRDVECRDWLSALFADEPEDWTSVVVSDGVRVAVIVHMDDRFPVGESSRDYLHVEIAVGGIGMGTLHYLDTCQMCQRARVVLSPAQFDLLERGELGTYLLFGDGGTEGILSVADVVSGYCLSLDVGLPEFNEHLTQDEARLLEDYRVLPATGRRTLLVVGRALAVDAAENAEKSVDQLNGADHRIHDELVVQP